MKLLDEKGRIFGIINIVDLAVLLVIVLLAGAIGYRLLGSDDNTPQANVNKYLITVKCPQAPETAINYIKEGDMLYYDNVGSLNYTSVVKAEAEPAQVEIITADGQIKMAQHPTLKDIYITFEFRTTSNDVLMLGGVYQMNVGKKFFFKTTRVELEAIVMDIIKQ